MCFSLQPRWNSLNWPKTPASEKWDLFSIRASTTVRSCYPTREKGIFNSFRASIAVRSSSTPTRKSGRKIVFGKNGRRPPKTRVNAPLFRWSGISEWSFDPVPQTPIPWDIWKRASEQRLGRQTLVTSVARTWSSKFCFATLSLNPHYRWTRALAWNFSNSLRGEYTWSDPWWAWCLAFFVVARAFEFIYFLSRKYLFSFGPATGRECGKLKMLGVCGSTLS